MKQSSCLNPKMATYCQEVRNLKDKFDGLELHHIPRCLNKAADTLAKMASGREYVLAGIFANKLHKHSIWIDEVEQNGNEPALSDPGVCLSPEVNNHSVMEVDQGPNPGSGNIPD